jgi:hypothetical protein
MDEVSLLYKSYALLADFLRTTDPDLDCNHICHAMLMLVDLGDMLESYNEDIDD